MLSYHNLVVSNVQAERSELAGYRVASGAKAEISPEAINREIGESRMDRGVIRRFALLLAVSAALVFVGVQGAGAQEQAGMFADADGMEPPDAGMAYEIPVHRSVAASKENVLPEVAAMELDVDGIEPPGIGFAYALPDRQGVVSAEKLSSAEEAALAADADGIEPPGIGVAYDIDTASRAYAERQQGKNRVAVEVNDRK